MGPSRHTRPRDNSGGILDVRKNTGGKEALALMPRHLLPLSLLLHGPHTGRSTAGPEGCRAPPRRRSTRRRRPRPERSERTSPTAWRPSGTRYCVTTNNTERQAGTGGQVHARFRRPSLMTCRPLQVRCSRLTGCTARPSARNDPARRTGHAMPPPQPQSRSRRARAAQHSTAGWTGTLQTP